GNYWVATDFEMKDLIKGTRSRMIITDIVFDRNLPDEEFTVRNLIR
ncbi:MAG: outer membrane lipoprotein-sorting protein, partial [Bacteroidales bacterium]|nr:outer membrane lipoprotein-sorting protein [Bacteroidales bacterium]